MSPDYEPTRRRSRPPVSVEAVAWRLSDDELTGTIGIYSRLVKQAPTPSLARFHREMAGALAEHLAERRVDPLWSLRFPEPAPSDPAQPDDPSPSG